MRKRLGILILIFSLFLFFPTQKTYGQYGKYSIGEALFELLLRTPFLIHGLYTESCFLKSHPGDYYYEKNYKFIKPININIKKCYNKCIQMSMSQNVVLGSLRSNNKENNENFGQCFNPCFKEAIKPFPSSIATCAFKESDDYYTDGSYYKPSKEHSSLSTTKPLLRILFKNNHKLKDKYKKTDWQKARDECMEITSKKKGKFFESKDGQFHRMFGLYNNCLKERGY